jgi:hypothetical protein
MLLLSHNLFVETAVIRGMDAPWVWLLLLRILAALFYEIYPVMNFLISPAIQSDPKNIKINNYLKK